MKLIVDESESSAIIDYLASDDDLALVASGLLHTELQCAAGRHPSAIAPEAARKSLETVDLSRGDMVAAGILTPLRFQ